jgi:hypothetical protein
MGSGRMASSGMLRRVALARTDVSEELSASFIRVTRIGELLTTLAVTSNFADKRRLLGRYSSPAYLELFTVPPNRCNISRTVAQYLESTMKPSQ